MPVINMDCQPRTPVASSAEEANAEKNTVITTRGRASKGNHCRALPRQRSSSAERYRRYWLLIGLTICRSQAEEFGFQFTAGGQFL